MDTSHFSRSIARTLALVAITGTIAAHATGRVEPHLDPPATELPKPSVIIERCIDAMGGKDALDTVKSGRANVVSTTVVGSFDVEFRWAKPTRFLLEMQRADQRYVIGCDGQYAWRRTPEAGWEVFEGSAAAGIIAQVGDFLAPFQLPSMLRSGFAGATLKTIEKTEFGGHMCYKVKSTNSKGFEQHLFFDADSGLFSGSEHQRGGFTGGTSKIITTLLEYKQVDPLNIYTRVHVEQGEIGASDIEFRSMEFNAVDESIFDLPQQARALLQDSARGPSTQPNRTEKHRDDDGGSL